MNNNYEQLSFMTKPLNNTNYTYKSSDLIESSYELTVTQQRIISLGCKKIQPIYIEKRLSPDDLKTVLGAMEFSMIEISTSEFKREYGIKGNNVYDYLEQACSDMYDNEVITIDKNKKKPLRKRWISTLEYDRGGEGIRLTFNVDMLLDLLVFQGKFVSLFFDMSQNITSKYTFRLYEILKSKAYLGTYKVTVDDLRFMLNVQDKYLDFSDFNKKILKYNQKIINEFSDIEYEFDKVRCGRSVKWIEFKIKTKKKVFGMNSDLKNKIPTSYKAISDALIGLNTELTSVDLEKLYAVAIEITKDRFTSKDPTTYILEKIDVLKKYVINNNCDDIVGYLISAMKNDYHIRPVQKKENIKTTKFNNFEPRDKDYDELERQLSNRFE